MNVRIIFIITFSLVTFCSAQDTAWGKWNWLAGEWIGEGSGQHGEGIGTFSFNFDLDKRILVKKIILNILQDKTSLLLFMMI